MGFINREFRLWLVDHISINETIIWKQQISIIILTDCQAVTKRTEDCLTVVPSCPSKTVNLKQYISIFDGKPPWLDDPLLFWY
jgi:hypothetical protein